MHEVERPERAISLERIGIIRFRSIILGLRGTFISRLGVVGELSPLVGLLILRQISKIYVIFAFHFVGVPQQKQIVFNQIQLNIFFLTVFEFGDRNYTETALFGHDKSKMVAGQQKNVAFLPVRRYQKQVFDGLMSFLNFYEIVSTYDKLKENLWLDCFAQSLFLYQLNLLPELLCRIGALVRILTRHL